MVEYRSGSLDATYHALAHPARRDVLQRLSEGAARITDLAAPHDMSFAAVSKHIRVLEEAGLVTRHVSGRDHWLELDATRLHGAVQWLDAYRRFWETGLDRLEQRLKTRRR